VSQQQLPSFGLGGQPIESSQLAHFDLKCIR
jgi:hypothetical protein